MKKIMVIDDDQHIGNALEEALAEEGYDVLRAYSGTEAVLMLEQAEMTERAEAAKPDLVLLDLMLPGLAGEEVLPRIKGIPVIVMSAKADIDNKVELLLGGAVDYVTKPFVMRELLARIAVHLRSFDASGDRVAELKFEDICLHTDTHMARVGGKEVKLTRTEYAILKILMQNVPRIVAKSALLDRISEETPDCTESSLKTHISHLRGKLSEVAGRDYIETVWGIGFRMKEAEKE